MWRREEGMEEVYCGHSETKEKNCEVNIKKRVILIYKYININRYENMRSKSE